MAERRAHLTIEAAERLSVQALSFITNHPESLERFLTLTGIDPGMIRAAASEPGFLVGVLDYFLSDEPLLVAFAADADIPPTEVAAARRALAPEDPK